MRSFVISKYAFVGILSALFIGVQLVPIMMDEQALFADLDSYYSLVAVAGGFLAIVIGSARMCGRCGGDLPMEKSAGCIIAMAGLVFFYPYLADFWNMPYSIVVLLFGVAFLLFFATIADALTAYTDRFKGLCAVYSILCVVFFVLAALYVIQMETNLIDFSGDMGKYLDVATIAVSAVYILISSIAAGALYRYDVPRDSKLGKTGETFSTVSSAPYVASLAEERAAMWKAEDEYASEIQDRLTAERDEQAAKDQAIRDAAVKAAQEKAAKEAKEKAEKEAAEKAEKEAKEKAEAEQAAKEAAEKEAAEAAAREQALKEAQEKEAAEQAAKEAQEKAEKEAAEAEAARVAEAEAAEQAAKEAQEKAAAEAAAREQALKEAQEKAEAEQAAKEAAEQAAKEAQEKAAAEAAAREQAEKRAEDAEGRANDQIVAREAAEKAAAAVAAAATAAAVSAASADKNESEVTAEDGDGTSFEETSGDDFADDEISEDVWTDNSPEALVRRAAWNKGLRCRRGYGDHKIPVAFVKGKVAVYVTGDNPDTSIDEVLKSEGWIVLRYNEFDITDGTEQGDEIAQTVKAHIREMNAAKKKKSKKKTSKS